MSLPDWLGLAVATFAAAALQGATGFGFAMLAMPCFLLFVDPAGAVQIVLLLTAALSAVVLKGLGRALAPRRLLRLMLGSLAGVPFGIAAFAFADPREVRLAVGAAILAFAFLLALLRRPDRPILLAMSPGGDIAAGFASGAVTTLTGMSGPPVLIYLILAGVPARAVRATLLAYFALSYAAAVLLHIIAVGMPARIWRVAGILLPFAFLGGVIGRPLGSRLGENAFAALAIGLAATAGAYTLAAAALAGQP